jgi:cytoskeletal protein RodZ
VLYIVLILILAALGLLVTALITASSLWAWVSIGLSVLAGVLLVLDFVRRRRSRKRAAQPVVAEKETADVESEEDAAEEQETLEQPEADQPVKPDQTELLPAAGEVEPETGDPTEEKTEPADAEVVAKLDSEVLVVDEYPRYHVSECSWLADRETIPIVIKEARELGFTPCARCTPDATLAAAHRATAKS